MASQFSAVQLTIEGGEKAYQKLDVQSRILCLSKQTIKYKSRKTRHLD